MKDRVIIAPGFFYIEQKHCFVDGIDYYKKMTDQYSAHLFASDNCPMFILVANIIYQCVLDRDSYVEYSYAGYSEIKGSIHFKYAQDLPMYLKDNKVVFFRPIQTIDWSFAKDLIDGKKPNV